MFELLYNLLAGNRRAN